MRDYDLTRINTAIRNKKNLIINNKFDTDELLDDISSAKIGIRRAKDDEREISFWKNRVKTYIDTLKQLKKDMIYHVKELKTYEAEYKKLRKDPNYNINFNLLKKKYNKGYTQL